MKTEKLKKPPKAIKPPKQEKQPAKPKKPLPIPTDPDERAFYFILTKTTRAAIARHLAIKKQNLTRWKKVPPHHAKAVAELTGLPREYVLPSMFA